MHDYVEVLIENGKTVIKKSMLILNHNHAEVIIIIGSTDITRRNCYADYGSRTKVPNKNGNAENNEK